MSKYYGKIGYVETVEGINPKTGLGNGVWTEQVTERFYYGDVERKTARWQSGENKNDEKTLSIEISIVADSYAYQHFDTMRYIEYMGNEWKITSIEPAHPRLRLSIGELYNGKRSS